MTTLKTTDPIVQAHCRDLYQAIQSSPLRKSLGLTSYSNKQFLHLFPQVFIGTGKGYTIDESQFQQLCTSNGPPTHKTAMLPSEVNIPIKENLSNPIIHFNGNTQNGEAVKENLSDPIIQFNGNTQNAEAVTFLDVQHNFSMKLIIALDLEGFLENETDYCLAQICADGQQAFLFDKLKGKEEIHKQLLSLLLAQNQSDYILIHDCHHDVHALSEDFVKSMYDNEKQFLDTQLVYEYYHNIMTGGLNKYLAFMNPTLSHESKDSIKRKMIADHHYWEHRPLQKDQIEYAAKDVLLLRQTAEKLFEMILASSETDNINLLQVFSEATRLRIEYSFKYGSEKRFYYFDKDFRMRSAELAEALNQADLTQGMKLSPNSQLQMLCSCKSLIDVFPDVYKTNSEVLKEDFLSRNVCDIALDYGKVPNIYCLNGEKKTLFPNTHRTVSMEDLEFITENLLPNEFGSDNRIGIENELHRISAIRNKKETIIGLTMRIGRFFVGNSYIISDLLFQEEYLEKSILVLGPPGSGKTSLIREIARLLATKQNVMIVDTSNEICGDSDIAHSCVGDARRMMVPDIDEQYHVMIECVQNHTPKVMVIDEIGRKREVEAAKTCKERGVRLVASAHGDFHSLLKNTDLRGLIGGVVPVTLGDIAAKKENHGNKIALERSGPPIFDIIIEVKKGKYNEFRIIKDSGTVVDKLLSGEKGKAELRIRELDYGDSDNGLSHNSQPQKISFSFIDF